MAIKYNTYIILLMLFVYNISSAQDGYLRMKSFQRIAYGKQASFAWSGAGISGGYTYKFTRKDQLNFGAEIGFLEWGAQTLPEIGYQHRFSIHNKIYLTAGAAVYNGIVLFRPKPFYSFAAQAQGGIVGVVNKKLDMAFYTGARYSLTPNYRNYSPVYSYWHFSAELVFIFKKPRKKSQTHINPSF